MIDFWLAAGLLLTVAMAFLLLPLVRARTGQREEDRTALNVALYQERLAELGVLHAGGTLSAEQLHTARAEAARELLADTDDSQARVSSPLGRTLPCLVALLVPLLGLGLYLQYGASDKLALAREFAEPPRSLEEMTRRLELAVQAQPEAAEGLYFLGRTYMTQNRPADAARLFERTVAVAGRQPEVLGQWAQALYFAGDKQWSASIQALVDEALLGDPNEPTSLGLLGIAAFEGQRYAQAIEYWQKLLALLPPQDSSRTALQGGIDRARAQLGQAPAPPVAAQPAARLSVRVDLAPALRQQVLPSDSVFVFARAVSGPPMPLAVKRVTVADLPMEIELADSDAMMPALKLSNFPEVQLVARVSRAGQPTQGEWIGRSQPVASQGAAAQHLTIDSPDP